MKPQITSVDRQARCGSDPASKELRHEAADHGQPLARAGAADAASKELRHEAADHPRSTRENRPGHLASKELRHEAADHKLARTWLGFAGSWLQRSCGMKPQITTATGLVGELTGALQRSCGMKPQITGGSQAFAYGGGPGFKGAAA
mgnify:CR=1 FL=1